MASDNGDLRLAQVTDEAERRTLSSSGYFIVLPILSFFPTGVLNVLDHDVRHSSH